jgi:hypothetical protein
MEQLIVLTPETLAQKILGVPDSQDILQRIAKFMRMRGECLANAKTANNLGRRSTAEFETQEADFHEQVASQFLTDLLEKALSDGEYRIGLSQAAGVVTDLLTGPVDEGGPL